MNLKDIGSVLSKIAPTIATALGGPAAGIAIATVSNALGLSEKTESALKDAIQSATLSPDQIQALKLADQQFAIKMQELGFTHEKDLEALAVQDRDSARKREIEVKDHTPRNLAYGITIGFFSIVMLMFFVDVPSSTRDLLNILLGMLGTSFSGIISYYYGSTNGSRLKTEMLAKAPPVKE